MGQTTRTKPPGRVNKTHKSSAHLHPNKAISVHNLLQNNTAGGNNIHFVTLSYINLSTENW